MIAGVLLAANAILAAGLALLALAPRRIVVVPSARNAAELLPETVPAAAAREFALKYVLHFDNFTPATVEDTQAILQRMIAARSWADATKALDRRLQIVREGKMSSQVIPRSVTSEGLNVTILALRRTFIADKLSRERTATYTLRLDRQPPTELNPYGLGVISQTIEETSKRPDPGGAPANDE